MTKAKYLTLRHKVKEVIWIKRFVNKFELEFTKSITIYSNNEMSIAFIKNVESQRYIKHIDVQYYYIRK